MKRADFLKAVAGWAATLDLLSESDAGNLCIDAPQGYVWNDGCHSIVEPFTNAAGQSWKSEAYTLATNRMKAGISKCDENDCDVCG